MSDITTGYSRPDADNIGGVDEIVVAQLEDIDKTNSTISDGEITALAMNSTKKGYRFFLEENLTNFQDVLTITEGNGTRMADQTVTMILNDMKKSTRNNLMDVATNWVVLFMKTSQGTWKVLGWDYGLKMRTGSGDSGTAKADRNGFTVAFGGQQKGLAYDIDGSLVTAILTPSS